MEQKNKKINSKTIRGVVVSDKMDKTIVVEAQRVYEHPVTGKVMKTAKRYKVHDQDEAAVVGDVVEFFEGRPASKSKYMYLARVVGK